MDRIRSGIRLLALFSIFFIYKAINAVIEDNQTDLTFWSMFTLVYLISLIILFFVIKKLEKEKNY